MHACIHILCITDEDDDERVHGEDEVPAEADKDEGPSLPRPPAPQARQRRVHVDIHPPALTLAHLKTGSRVEKGRNGVNFHINQIEQSDFTI